MLDKFRDGLEIPDWDLWESGPEFGSMKLYLDPNAPPDTMWSFDRVKGGDPVAQKKKKGKKKGK